MFLQLQKRNRNTSQLITQIVSAAGFALMIIGLAVLLWQDGLASFPGDSAVPLSELTHVTQAPLPLLLVSIGMVLLAFLPALLVFLKLISSLRQQHTVTVVVALIVLAELLLSIPGD
jgi:hypothetical protein